LWTFATSFFASQAPGKHGVITAVPSPVAVITLLFTVSAFAEPVSFRDDIAPILQQRCVACHGEEKAKGGYRLDSFDVLAKPGDSGEAPFSAGDPAKSTLHSLLIAEDKDERMPQKSDALPSDEIALIQR
jgi:mono/diheme cytochrome c family protein